MQLLHEARAPACAGRLGPVAADFAGHIAMAVGLGKLSDEAACEALWSYALARCPGKRCDAAILRADLMAEYRRRRDGLELCN